MNEIENEQKVKSIADALELCRFSTNASTYTCKFS